MTDERVEPVSVQTTSALIIFKPRAAASTLSHFIQKSNVARERDDRDRERMLLEDELWSPYHCPSCKRVNIFVGAYVYACMSTGVYLCEMPLPTKTTGWQGCKDISSPSVNIHRVTDKILS